MMMMMIIMLIIMLIMMLMLMTIPTIPILILTPKISITPIKILLTTMPTIIMKTKDRYQAGVAVAVDHAIADDEPQRGDADPVCVLMRSLRRGHNYNSVRLVRVLADRTC